MKLKYWIAVDPDGDYSVRLGTKKQATALREEAGEDAFEPPYPVVVEYDSGLDLLQRARSLGWHEGQAQRLYYQTNRAYREWYDQRYPHEEWRFRFISEPVDPDYLAIVK